jgi:hypothetical protein
MTARFIAFAMQVHKNTQKSNAVRAFQGVIVLLLGMVVSYLGYQSSSAPLDLDEVIGPALFWCTVLALLFRFPFRDAAATTYRALRTRLGTVLFWPYLAVHLFVYGFLLELMLGSIYGFTLTLSPSISVTTDAFLPPTLVSTLLDLSYNPSIAFTLPPALSGVLSFYSISIAIVVDVLILANVAKVIELGQLCTLERKARTYFLLPAVGLVLGASCCLSVPALISFVLPSVAALPAYFWIYYSTYFFFPAFAIVILYLNAASIDRISARLSVPPVTYVSGRAFSSRTASSA